MATSALRRLSASGKSHLFNPAATSAAAARTTKLNVVKTRLVAIDQCLIGKYFATANPRAPDFVAVRGLARVAAAAEEPRETSPKLEPESKSASSSEAPRKTYVERLNDGQHWIPAHWVTVLYKNFLGSNRAVSPDDALLLLNCFDARLAEESPDNRVKMVEKAWQDLKAAGTRLDVRHYNALLSVYLANDHAFDPEDFLRILSEDGVAMNDDSYLLFVQRYCQTGNVVDAMRTLEFMKSKEMKMTRPLFHALIAGHIRAGDLDGAERIGAMMNQSYSDSDRDFLPAILTHARMGNVEKLLDSLVDMKSRSFKPKIGDVLKALSAYLDWCVEENKYPEGSALDSLYDTLKDANYMPGFNGIVCQTIVHLMRLGFNDVAADVLRLFPQAVMAKIQFFKNAVRFLPFTDVLRYCDDMGQASGTDPTTEFCLPNIRNLPLENLEQVLIDAKECDFPVETITEIVESKLPIPESRDDYLTGKSARGPSFQRVALLAIQLELPLVKDAEFWEKRAFTPGGDSFDGFYRRFTETGSKHDQPLIEACKPAMMRGFVNFYTKSQNLDRLKLVADVLRDNPDFVPEEKSTRGVFSRLCYAGNSTANTLPDAIYILRRYNQFTGRVVSNLLTLVTKKNPDPRLIASILEAAEDSRIYVPLSDIDNCLKQTQSTQEVQQVLRDTIESYRRDYLEPSVLEKMSLKEMVKYEREKKNNLSFAIVVKAATDGEEETALEALSKITSRGAKARALPFVVDMYVSALEDGFKALEYLEFLVQDFANGEGVEISSLTILRLVEILLRNGQSLKDLRLFDEIAQTDIKLVTPFGEHDRRVLVDHVAFVSSLDEEKETIDAYLNRLASLNLGPYYLNARVAGALRKEGVKEALELLKTYVNEESKSADGKGIPCEENLLDAIVASEDVALLKEFLDLSTVVHGERNAFLNLAFALYKGGKYAQGRRILNIPGLRSEDGMVTRYCEKLLANERYDALENFSQDVCCLFGVDKAELACFKLRSLMARGGNANALGYVNDLMNQGFSMNDPLRQQAASLYGELGLEYHDKSVVAVNYNLSAYTPPDALFEGNVTEVLRNIRGGTDYPPELYKHLVEMVVPDNPSPVLDALAQRGNVAALEFLDAGGLDVKSHIALVYLREDRLDELLSICRASGRPQNYLTAVNLQYLRTKSNSDELIRRVEEFATTVGDKELLENVFGLYLSLSQVEKAKDFLAKHPSIGSEHLPLTHVYSYATLLAVTEMDVSGKTKGEAYNRMIHNAAHWRVSTLVEEAVDKMYASNIGFYVSPALRNRVKKVVGRDLFVSSPRAGEKAEAIPTPLDAILENDLIESIPDLDTDETN